jgi:hypothetical protein
MVFLGAIMAQTNKDERIDEDLSDAVPIVLKPPSTFEKLKPLP